MRVKILNIVLYGYINICISILLNLSWEFTAFYYDIANEIYNENFIIHLTWLFFDIIILILWYIYHKSERLMIISLFPLLICEYFIFKIYLGELLVCFIIDLLMATIFMFHISLIYYKKYKFKNRELLFFIGLGKLLGDFFAFLRYKNFSYIVYL